MKDSPFLPLFVRKAAGAAPEHTINLTLKRGVRAALEYAASGDIAKTRAATNPDVAPHLQAGAKWADSPQAVGSGAGAG